MTRATLRIGIIDTNYRLVADRLLIDAAEGNPNATLTREQFLLHVLEEHGLLDGEISQVRILMGWDHSHPTYKLTAPHCAPLRLLVVLRARARTHTSSAPQGSLPF